MFGLPAAVAPGSPNVFLDSGHVRKSCRGRPNIAAP